MKYKFILFSCSSLLSISAPFSVVLPNSHNLLQISKVSGYGWKTLLSSLAVSNLECLIQHITDATVLVTSEDLASNYGKGLPFFQRLRKIMIALREVEDSATVTDFFLSEFAQFTNKFFCHWTKKLSKMYLWRKREVEMTTSL